MGFPYGVTVTVRRKGKRDNFGDPVPGPDGKDSTHTLAGCAVSWRNSLSVVEVTRIGTVTEVALLAPTGANLRAFDQVQLPDQSWWWVDGEPARPYSPFSGWRPGVRATLRSLQTPPKDDKKKDDKKKDDKGEPLPPNDKPTPPDRKKKEEGEPLSGPEQDEGAEQDEGELVDVEVDSDDGDLLAAPDEEHGRGL